MSRFYDVICVGLCIAMTASASGAQQGGVPAPRPAWEGVWQGTIGTLPVHVCLARSYEAKGAYYYDRHLQLIRLTAGEADGRWIERDDTQKDGAEWKLDSAADLLRGTWSDGKQELPVQLTRIEGAGDELDGPCGSLAFLRPRTLPAKPISKQLIKDGERYTSVTFKPGPWLKEVEIKTFTLDRPGPQIAKVNALLLASLPKADGTGEWFDCVAASVSSTGRDGSYLTSIEPGLIGKRWLAANEQIGVYCGGAHPSTFDTPRTFDLVEGTEVDPLDWFGPQAVDREDLGGGSISKSLTPAFVKEILSDREFDDSVCGLATEEQKYWSAGIKAGALVLSPRFPHALMDCSRDFELPLARLQPWLSDEGKKLAATLPVK